MFEIFVPTKFAHRALFLDKVPNLPDIENIPFSLSMSEL
jgi:hypothetical protein